MSPEGRLHDDLLNGMSSSEEIETGNHAPERSEPNPHAPIVVVDWNINRGLKLGGILDFLAAANADLILLQEVDINARRTHRRHIAREISQKLRMNYVFGREFQELSQGSRTSPAYHGQATLSPWPLSRARILRFQRQSHFWRPRWFLPKIAPFQERIGGRMALVTEMTIGGLLLCSYNLHLESRDGDIVRRSQLDECLRDIRSQRAGTPIVLAGDLNLDASHRPVADVLARAGLDSAASREPAPTTPSNSLFKSPRAIDWIFHRGSVHASNLRIHNSVSESDHFPISIELHLQVSEIQSAALSV